MNTALALAGLIATLDRHALEHLVVNRIDSSRPTSALEAIGDPLTLALDLLRSESIAPVLAELDRASLVALHRMGTDSSYTPHIRDVQVLADLGLVGLHDGRPVELQEVTHTLEKLAQTAGVDIDQDPAAAPRPSRPAVPSSPDNATPAVPSSRGNAASVDAGTDGAGTGAAIADADLAGTDAADTTSPGSDAEQADWFVPALMSSQLVAALLRVLVQQPGRVNRRGTVAVATAKTLTEHTNAELDSVKRLVPLLSRAGLTEHVMHADGSGGKLVVTRSARHWFGLSHIDRWLALASAQITTVSLQARRAIDLAQGDLHVAMRRVLGSEFPLAPAEVHDEAEAFIRLVEDLGLTSEGRFTRAAMLLFTGDRDGARDVAAQHMPPAIERVYVQPDLSVIVPGPLAPHDEQVLMTLADTEQVGVASTLRITAETLARALDSGQSADRIRDELERLSLTGVPQPVTFLLDELLQRGAVVVHEHHGDEGRTRVDVTKRSLFETLQIDRSLQHLQLSPAPADDRSAQHGLDQSRDGQEQSQDNQDQPAQSRDQPHPPPLFSRLGHEHVLTTLLDARYPATTARARTETTHMEPHAGHNVLRASLGDGVSGDDGTDAVSAPRGDSEEPPALDEPLRSLVDRVAAAATTEPGSADVARRLELAIRRRSTVRVTASAQGEERDFTLLPVSLSGGRLRATDVTAGVERTLPLSAIVAVVPATEHSLPRSTA